MENTNILIVIETLAAEINLLRYDKERLEAENAALKTALESRLKVSVEVGGNE